VLAHSIPSWLVWAEIKYTFHAALPEWTKNQSSICKQQLLRDYCPNMYTVLLNVQNLRGSSHYSQRVCVIDRTPVIKLYNSKLEWNYFKCSAESFRNNRYEWPHRVDTVTIDSSWSSWQIFQNLSTLAIWWKDAINHKNAHIILIFLVLLVFMSFDWKYKAASQESEVKFRFSKMATNFYEISNLI
jgi:hypothetical protein